MSEDYFNLSEAVVRSENKCSDCCKTSIRSGINCSALTKSVVVTKQHLTRFCIKTLNNINIVFVLYIRRLILQCI